jgi:hypothetical protein
MGSIMEQLQTVESRYSLFDLHVDDVPVWERVRFDIFRNLRQGKFQETDSPSDIRTTDYLGGVKLLIKNSFYRNPFLSGKHDFLFVGHTRRKRESDGHWWDIYCDPIHQVCSLDSVQFEVPYQMEHRTPARTDSLRYVDLIEYAGTIQRKLGFHKITLSDEVRERLQEAEKAFERQFSCRISLVDRVIRTLRNRRSRLWLYQMLLRRVDPKVAVVVISYRWETFIEACQSLDIPVVELQHGVIYPEHPGYAFSGTRTKEAFPDYLLTWGEFWGENVAFPIPDERVIPVGYPYLEQRRDQYEQVTTEDQIVFLSQPNIGEELSKFAVEVANDPGTEYDVVYKLHPDEYNGWSETYPWLDVDEIRVVDESGPSLYELFAESRVQVGVSSTAIYEGLMFDLETYIYDCGGTSAIQPLIASESARLITAVDELATNLSSRTMSFERERYFSEDATTNVCETLESLVSQ